MFRSLIRSLSEMPSPMSAVTKQKPDHLRISPITAAPVQDRGALMLPAEIAAHPATFNGIISGRWVLENTPIHLRKKVGRKVCFYLNEMIAWAGTIDASGVPQ